MRHLGLILVLCLSCGTASAAGSTLSFALSPDGRVARIEHDHRHELVLREGASERRLALPAIDAVHDEDPAPVVSWSSDGRHLAVEYRVAGERGVVAILDAARLVQLQAFDVLAAAWTSQPGELVFVAAYDPDTGPVHPGMGRMDVVSGNTVPLGGPTYYAAPIQVRGPWVVARTRPHEYEDPPTCLATVHIETGAVAEFACAD